MQIAPLSSFKLQGIGTDELRGPLAPTPTKRVVEEVVALSRCSRAGLWLLLFIIVAANASILATQAYVYSQCNVRDSLLWDFRVYYLTYHASQYMDEAAPHIALGYAILAALFFLYAAQLAWSSVSGGGLLFGAKKSTFTMTRFLSTNRLRTRTASLVAVRTPSLVLMVRHSFRRFQFLIGVRGPYFDIRLLVDDAVEMITQTSCAFVSSRSVSNVGLNIAYGVVIFLTSVSPSVFRRIFRKSLVKQRMACLLADLIFDFVWGTILPLWMFLGLLKIYNNRNNRDGAFDQFTNNTREIERVLVLSWSNFALTVIPYLATISNLVEIQSILREVNVHPADAIIPSTGARTVLTLTYSTASPDRHAFIVRLMHFFVPVYGTVALITTVIASRMFASTPPSHALYECLHPVYPWFTTLEGCVGRRVNCTFAGINGSEAELTEAFDSFSTASLGDLMLYSCPRLEIPASITRFTRLRSLVIKRSTLLSWSEDAAATSENFPLLSTVNMEVVDLEQVPLGLVVQPLAPQLEWIHFVKISNATDTLTSAGNNWNQLRFFDCFMCGLVSFPPIIITMPFMSMLHLGYNDIPDVPDEWLMKNPELRLQALWFDGNERLQTLPDALWRQAAWIDIFSIENSGITTVPDRLSGVAVPAFVVFAAGTPLCGRLDQLSEAVKARVVCEPVNT